MTDRPFAGKVALVTGSSRGIGRAIALRLAHDGADVVVNFRRREDEARATGAEIEQLGSRALLVQANMAEPADIERLFATVGDELGALDFLVCNAAAGMQGTMLEATVKAWDLAMNAVLAHLPGRARLRATVPREELLLVRDSWAPGWEARLDGRSVPIHQAAGIYFAVAVPAGVHEVEIAYHAPGFRPGLSIAAMWSAGSWWMW